MVITDDYRLPTHDHIFTTRNLFENARWYFGATGKPLSLSFATPPDVLHCTYPIPIRCKSAVNIFTIHDLVPLRLPHTTLDNKRYMYRLLRNIAATADHIVTVSENSKKDIMNFLGVEEDRITNTYQSVEFPPEYVNRPLDGVIETLEGSFGLEYGKYLLFYAALEPKKNVVRLIDAYFTSGVDLPLVLVASGGWGNDAEIALVQGRREEERLSGRTRRRIIRLDYASIPMLTTIIRGACAVIFPSLYEGFGLPVLEAMVLGTPVVTSNVSSLPEIAGDAALLVNPYDVGDISRAIRMIVEDVDLRSELIARGRTQAAMFSVDRYRERLAQLYQSLR
jgi:glycosyltransferase involved in cell wall biosynthesis